MNEQQHTPEDLKAVARETAEALCAAIECAAKRCDEKGLHERASTLRALLEKESKELSR